MYVCTVQLYCYVLTDLPYYKYYTAIVLLTDLQYYIYYTTIVQWVCKRRTFCRKTLPKPTPIKCIQHMYVSRTASQRLSCYDCAITVLYTSVRPYVHTGIFCSVMKCHGLGASPASYQCKYVWVPSSPIWIVQPMTFKYVVWVDRMLHLNQWLSSMW